MTAAEALRDALARIVIAREWLGDGAVDEAAWLLADLEDDLVVVLARLEETGAA
jgi:hypothetical protein